MQLTLTPKWLGIGGGILALVLLFMAYQYIQSERADAEMKATIAANEKVVAQLKESNERLEQLVKSVREDANRQIEDIQRQRESIRTPEQAIRIIPQVIPIQQPQVQTLPDAPSVLSQADAKKLADFGLEFQQMRIEVTALKEELRIERERITNKDAELVAVRNERDAAIKAAKGGTWLQRLGKGAKMVGIGIGIGVAIGTRI